MPTSRRIALTGATHGLGRALVTAFAKLGHAVHGCGRSADRVAELTAAHGEPHAFDVVDVADPGSVQRWAERTISRGGPPDLLINNAGLINASAPLWEVPDDELAQVIEVNLTGTARVMQAFLPAMIARGSGVVVNMSSGWGRSTAPEVAPYCATKWGVEGLSQAVAQEVPRGMVVVAVNPGVIDTRMLRSCFGMSAGGYESPDTWARRAAPFLLGLGPADNGCSLSAP